LNTAATRSFADTTAPFALFDDNLGSGGDLLLADWIETIQCTDPRHLTTTLARIEAARQADHWVALALAYELGLALEPRLEPLLPPAGQPLLTAWVFRRAARLSVAQTDAWLAAGTASPPPAGLGRGTLGLAESRYHQQVGHIRDYIAAGDCYQVNYTFPLTGELWGPPRALYQRLRAAQPVRHGAFIQHPEGWILSRSPELFLDHDGRGVTCRPMKGTAPRQADPAALLTEKNRAENLMIVDLIRNDLGRLAPSGGVKVERLFQVEAYPSLWQLTSTIRAEPVTANLAALLAALFPCGSITGAPKIRAMEIIAELETQPRGLYCGALGWLAPDGPLRLAVPIRTLEVDAHRQARLGIGSGIVQDSDPAAEWQECLLKARFLTELPPELRLIETLRREPDGSYPLLPWHLERLQASAAYFGFPFSKTEVEAALAGVPADPAGHPLRVRLTLGPAGDLEITSAPLAPPEGPATVTLAPERLDSREPLLRHKTTARAHYDQAMARAMAAGHFDTLFCNERGELCEGARSNLFLRLDGELLTPAADCGLLNGVLRRSLLAAGRAREARLTLADLHRAEAVFAGNALRGLTPVTLVAAGQV
jgi:para-aminobenzoate synthetase/4-amino-4-deoxychorismate lyase